MMDTTRTTENEGSVHDVMKEITAEKQDDSRWDEDYYQKMRGQEGTVEKAYEVKEQDGQAVVKADSPITTGTTGSFNAVYGAEIWQQFNSGATPFAVLPKQEWNRSGWRVETQRPSATDKGAVEEAGAVPDSISSTFDQLDATPKTVAHVGEVSEIQNLLADTGDDVAADIVDMRNIMSRTHRRDIALQLMESVESTVPSKAMTPLDKIVSSADEVANNASISSGSADVYGIARDGSNPWADAVVSENAGTLRTLTDQLIRDVKNTVNDEVGQMYGQRVWLTGGDTRTAIEGLYDDQTRYNVYDQTQVTSSVNGVESINGEPGQGRGYNVDQLYGYPLITFDEVPSAPQGGLSKVFFLDIGDPEGFGNPRLGIDVLKPTSVYEAGLGTDNDNPFITGKLSGKIMVQTIAEVKCARFNAHGKITDIQSA